MLYNPNSELTPANSHTREFINSHYEGVNFEESKKLYDISQIKALKECEKIPECSKAVMHLLAKGYNFCSSIKKE